MVGWNTRCTLYHVLCNMYRVISGIVVPSRLVDPLMIVDLSCSPATPPRGGHDKIRTKIDGSRSPESIEIKSITVRVRHSSSEDSVYSSMLPRMFHGIKVLDEMARLRHSAAIIDPNSPAHHPSMSSSLKMRRRVESVASCSGSFTLFLHLSASSPRRRGDSFPKWMHEQVCLPEQLYDTFP